MIYFGGNDITTPLIVLVLYALAGVAVISYLDWNRPARQARPPPRAARAELAERHRQATRRRTPPARSGPCWPILVALGICAVMQCLFASNYMSAAHEPAKRPTCRSASSDPPRPDRGREDHSPSKVTQYPNESAAKTAIDQAQIWGALITSGTPTTLIVVPSISDLAPLDLAVRVRGGGQERRAEAHRAAVRAGPAGRQGPVRPGPVADAGAPAHRRVHELRPC